MGIRDTKFYKTAKKMLEEYVQNGGNVESLSTESTIYKYIKNTKVVDENGKAIDLETKFELLGYPRKSKVSKNLREDLICEIREYLVNGGSFHIERKKLPFYERLHSYQVQLKHKGINLTHEQIMKDDLGFKEFSDVYFRCLGIEKLKYFRDKEGFVDSYKAHVKFNNYIKEIAQTYQIPIYFVTTLLADEKTRKYAIHIDKVKYTERLLQNYVAENGTLVGIKRNNKAVYEAFEYLTKYYSDGTETKFSKAEWLKIFGLDEVEHKFQTTANQEEINVEGIMNELKLKYQDNIINMRELDPKDYRTILKKAVSLNISMSDLFKSYGLKSNSVKSERLSKVWVKEIPYLDEMKALRDKIMAETKISLENGCCKEEVFESKLKAVLKVYEEYKEKLESFLPEQYEIGTEASNGATIS